MKKVLSEHSPKNIFWIATVWAICVWLALWLACLSSGAPGTLSMLLIITAVIIIGVPFYLLFKAYVAMHHDFTMAIIDQPTEQKKAEETEENTGVEPGT